MVQHSTYPTYKPSNVSWLGDIPEHWEAKKLKYSTSTSTGFAFSSDDYVSNGIPLIRISDVLRYGTVDVENAKRLPLDYLDNFRELVICRNDILMAMTGATIGKSARYLFDTPGLLNQRVCKFLPNSISLGYLWYVLNSESYLEHIRITCFGGAQPNISDRQLIDFHSAFPPFEEQQTIARFLDFKTAQIDALIQAMGGGGVSGQNDKKKNMVSLLQEYRSALITNAVTGKIDVRGFEIPSHNQTKELVHG